MQKSDCSSLRKVCLNLKLLEWAAAMALPSLEEGAGEQRMQKQMLKRKKTWTLYFLNLIPGTLLCGAVGGIMIMGQRRVLVKETGNWA